MGKRIIIAGGGTGGHIFPAIAIANALKKLDAGTEILFVGAKGKMEMEKVPQAGYGIKGLDITGFNRSSLIKNVGLPFRLLKSFFQVRSIFRTFRPEAAVGVGGYSSFPVLRLAQARSIPTFIHESNSFAGRSNRMLARRATKIFTGTDGMEKFFPAEKILVTGNPVRSSIAEKTVSREEAVRFFSLDPARTTVLVIGGSQGARSVNEAIESGFARIVENGLQLIWQTGRLFHPKVEVRKSAWIGEFITKMEFAYAAADMIVSRSGAMSVAEICVAGKPVVFVPYPHAAEDHQTVNAMRLVNRDAALLIRDAEAREKLVPTVLELAADEERRREMKKNLEPLAITNADDRIAAEILKRIA
ncbi:MAG TPA: undecaprenyldiphospho-muramoylpentapeptide beta-N-acetylglucosaminyltransferase [Chitinophagaceae bacterium]|nr:undecaprenyldiphospho-muramoylpentapeptide beta-N-acetylglucosaminyltransferase [Chitinophagaceae bacterium]